MASARRSRRSRSPLLRRAALATVASAVLMPLVRKPLRVPPGFALANAAAAPFALAVVRPRTKGRDAGIFFLQMWAFLIAHEMPFDNPDGARRRLRVDYPVRLDTALGAGTPPTIRLQGLRSPDRRPTQVLDGTLSWVHWLWFLEPYCALAWILVRRERQFPRAAARMAATFDLGCLVYYMAPTAPPWWASQEAGRMGGRVQRVMVEAGERFWGPVWPALYGFLGGNPWATMPSLHFATSLTAATVLSEAGPVAGALGWTYAGALGFSLVYLGEHYLADLFAGLLLVELIRRGEPAAASALRALSPRLQRLERFAAA